MAKTREPWERLKNETEVTWECFRAFLQLTERPRHVGHLAEALGRSSAVCHRYSSRFRWFERAAAYDDAQARAQDKVVLSAAQQMAREQLQAWRAARVLATTTIARTLELAKDNPRVPPATLRDAVALLDKATNYERLITGEATSREEGRHELDIGRLEPGDAEKLLELLTRAGYTDSE